MEAETTFPDGYSVLIFPKDWESKIVHDSGYAYPEASRLLSYLATTCLLSSTEVLEISLDEVGRLLAITPNQMTRAVDFLHQKHLCQVVSAGRRRRVAFVRPNLRQLAGWFIPETLFEQLCLFPTS